MTEAIERFFAAFLLGIPFWLVSFWPWVEPLVMRG
jgi:hypothetical protein